MVSTSSQEPQAFWVPTWSGHYLNKGIKLSASFASPICSSKDCRLVFIQSHLVDEPKAMSRLGKVMDGADGVYHLGWDFRSFTRRILKNDTGSYFGTRALLRAAEQAKVRRFVHCSSSITVGFTRTEPDPNNDCEDWASSSE